jgi:ketosteroid isomerase-like protein
MSNQLKGVTAMRISVLLTIFVLVVSVFTQDHTPGSSAVPDSLMNVFNQAMTRWMDAYNGGDATKLVPLDDENAEYVSSHVTGLVASGRKKLIENFQNGINSGGHIDHIEIISVNYSCDLATLVCKYEATTSGQKAIGRNLIVMKKTGDSWVIIIHMTVV